MSAQTTIMGGVRGHLGMGKLQILGIDSVILWKYVGMLLWPSQLSVLYDPLTQGILIPIVISSLVWIGVGILCWKSWKRHPLVSFAVITWFLLLLPVLNLFPITTLMNDRYLYLPCLCVFTLGAGLLRWVGQKVIEGEWLALRRRELAMSFAAGVIVCTSLVGLCLCDGDASARLAGRPLVVGAHCQPGFLSLPVVQIQWANALHDSGETARAVNVLERALTTLDADEADRQRMAEKIAKWKSEL